MGSEKKIIIFGNSGSGKSTLAKKLVNQYGLAHLDLDVLAWQEEVIPPARKPIQASEESINAFLSTHPQWVIEGGYSDLLGLLLKSINKMVFLNPGVDQCIENCSQRPWEPHKYASLEAQNANLPMLLDWVREYPNREDEFSLSSHQKLFAEFTGEKIEYHSNDR